MYPNFFVKLCSLKEGVCACYYSTFVVKAPTIPFLYWWSTVVMCFTKHTTNLSDRTSSHPPPLRVPRTSGRSLVPHPGGGFPLLSFPWGTPHLLVSFPQWTDPLQGVGVLHPPRPSLSILLVVPEPRRYRSPRPYRFRLSTATSKTPFVSSVRDLLIFYTKEPGINFVNRHVLKLKRRPSENSVTRTSHYFFIRCILVISLR